MSESTPSRDDESQSNSEDLQQLSPSVEMTDEEKLRQEAAKRLERRKRKMMSPEERLAKITGRPVEQSPPSPIESPMPNGVANEEIPTTTYTSSSNVDDPPLENLTRDPFTAETPTAEGEFLSNILGGQSNQTSYIDPVQFSYSIWPMLAIAVRVLLETDYSWILGNNMLTPFVLMITILITLGYLSVANLQSTSLLTAGSYNISQLLKY